MAKVKATISIDRGGGVEERKSCEFNIDFNTAEDEAEAYHVQDRVTETKYRIVVDNGVLKIEEVV